MSKTQRSRWPMPGKAQEVGVVGPSQPFEPAAVAGRQQHECVRIARARRGTQPHEPRPRPRGKLSRCHTLSCECRERKEPRGAGDGRDDELVEVVEHGSCEELAERSWVAVVGAAECGEVA